MKPAEFFAIFAFFLVAIAHGAAPDPTFKGIPFGTGCASFQQKYKPSGEWAERGGKPTLNVDSSSCAIVLTPPSKVMKDPFGKTWFEAMRDTVAGAKADVRFYFSIQSEADLKAAKKGFETSLIERALFSEVKAEFEIGTAEQVLAALKQKYGDPVWTGNAYSWKPTGMTIAFTPSAAPRGKPLLRIKATTVPSISAAHGASDL